MAVSCGAKCAKYLLIIFNFIFWLSGAAILGVGIWFTVDEELQQYSLVTRLSSTDPLLQYVGYILIGVGGFVFIVGFLGCCGAIHENKCMLGSYMFLLIVVLAGELAAGILAIIYYQQWNDKAKDELTTMLRTKYTNKKTDVFVKAMDTIQKDEMCCGILNYTDYQFGALHNMTNQSEGIPSSCCEKPDDMSCIRNASVIYDPDNPLHSNTKFYKKGCFGALEEWFKNHSIILIGVGIGIACLELFGLIFAICLCRDIGEPQKA